MIISQAYSVVWMVSFARSAELEYMSILVDRISSSRSVCPSGMALTVVRVSDKHTPRFETRRHLGATAERDPEGVIRYRKYDVKHVC